MAQKQKDSSLDELVRKIVRETNTEIKKEDAKRIVQVIIPEIDRVIEEKVMLLCGNIDQMIANKVSEHFLLIGVFMSKKFNPHGE
jgi:hypothetical protein